MKIPPVPRSKISAILPQASEYLLPTHEPPAVESDEGLWDFNWVSGVLSRKALLILQIAISTTMLATGVLYLTSTAAKPKYEGTFQIQVEPATAEAKSSRSFLRGQTTERALEETQTNNLEQSSSLDYETQIRILKSSKLLDPIVTQIQQRYPHITYNSLAKNLNIDRIKITKDGKEQGTKLLKVEYTAASAPEINFVLDLVSQAYLRYSFKERQTNIRQGIKFIDDQTPQIREQVNKVQAQIQALRQQSNLMDPEQQGVEFSQLLSALKRQQLETATKLAEAQARYKILKQKFSGGNSIAVLSELPSSQKSIDRYRDLENQIAVAAARLQEDSPTIQTLRDEQKNIRDLLNKEAAQTVAWAADRVAAMQTQQQSLNQSQADLTRQFQQLPSISAKYAALKQELKISSETLDRYLSKREILGIDVAQQEVPWELISRPTLTSDSQGRPVNLSEQNKRLLVSLAAILAILLAVAVAFLIEILQDLIYTPAEIQRLSKLPVLGTIPIFDNSNPHKLNPSGWLNLTDRISASSRPAKIQFFKEAFNSLYSNIGFASTQTNIQTIAVSSLGSQDGKSLIATNLARAAAIAGNKVLLVDADLRSPRLHTYLNLDNSRGLSDSILLQNGSANDSNSAFHYIQPSCLDENLYVLTAGQVSSNPVRLLSSPTFKSLMQEFAAEFDLVIYDTPALNFADLSWVGSQVDGIIIVAKLGKTQRNTLAQAIQNLRNSQLPILGLVANGARNVGSNSLSPNVSSTSKLHYPRSTIFLPASDSSKKVK
jgi:polysaccharide biosynthesis transport protein